MILELQIYCAYHPPTCSKAGCNQEPKHEYSSELLARLSLAFFCSYTGEGKAQRPSNQAAVAEQNCDHKHRIRNRRQSDSKPIKENENHEQTEETEDTH